MNQTPSISNELDFVDDGLPVYSTPFSIDLFNMQGAENIGTYFQAIRSLPTAMYRIMMDHTTGIVINKTIGDVYSLSAEQCKELTRIVRDVLLSKIYVGDLVDVIAKQLVVDADVSQKIANELVAKLFKSAMDDIKALQVAHFSDRIGKPTGDNVLNLKKK